MILEKIVKEKREEIEELLVPGPSLLKKLNEENFTIIAEIKKASPSKGIISDKFNPQLQLRKYIEGGADAVSILTDSQFFQGSKELLKELRSRTNLPVLRKDFIIDTIQVYESFFMGADVVLLIAAALTYQKLRELICIAHKLKMEALVEVHSAEELETAVECGAKIIGINNRNLNDFSIDLKTTEKLLDKLKTLGVRNKFKIISESGIKNKRDIDYLKNLGVDGVLIGETLMKAEYPDKLIKEFKSTV